MNVAILGGGRMGTALARLFVDAGHQVRLANSRGPDSLRALVAELGPRAGAGRPDELMAWGDVVVLATRWNQTPDAVAGLGLWDGKIVIDTTNNRIGPRRSAPGHRRRPARQATADCSRSRRRGNCWPRRGSRSEGEAAIVRGA